MNTPCYELSRVMATLSITPTREISLTYFADPKQRLQSLTSFFRKYLNAGNWLRYRKAYLLFPYLGEPGTRFVNIFEIARYLLSFVAAFSSIMQAPAWSTMVLRYDSRRILWHALDSCQVRGIDSVKYANKITDSFALITLLTTQWVVTHYPRHLLWGFCVVLSPHLVPCNA